MSSLEEIQNALGRAIALEEENAELRDRASRAEAEARDFKRRLKDAERDLAEERVKGKKQSLTPALEKWLLQKHCTVTFRSTARGKFEVKLSVGRRADGRSITVQCEHDAKQLRLLRDAIEVAKTSGR